MRSAPVWATEVCRFPQRQFRYLFERVDREVPPDAEIVTAYTDGHVTLRRNRRVEGYHEAASLDGFRGVARGDFVVHGLDILRGSIGVSDSDGAISAVCTTCRPRAGVEPRFFAYAIRAQAWSGYTRAFARGVREGGADFRRWSTLGDLRLPTPPLRDQHVIAEFLDTKTARIDALIVKKQQMIDLLTERLRAVVMDELFGASGTWVRVGRLVDLLPGFAFRSDLFSTDEARSVRLLRGINVSPGSVRWNDCVYLDESLTSGVERFALESGDLVIGMDRPFIGTGMRVAEITEADVPSLLVQRVARLRVNDLAETAWVRFGLMSDAFVAYFSPIVTGVSVPHVSPDQIASFKLPLPNRETQRRIIQRVTHAEQVTRRLSDAAANQITLLQEHRQSLVTMCVTGQLDVAKNAA